MRTKGEPVIVVVHNADGTTAQADLDRLEDTSGG